MSISKFDHRNINGGALSKIHDVTGGSLLRVQSTHENIYGAAPYSGAGAQDYIQKVYTKSF
jgi:hypothetical protein